MKILFGQNAPKADPETSQDPTWGVPRALSQSTGTPKLIPRFLAWLAPFINAMTPRIPRQHSPKGAQPPPCTQRTPSPAQTPGPGADQVLSQCGTDVGGKGPGMGGWGRGWARPGW